MSLSEAVLQTYYLYITSGRYLCRARFSFLSAFHAANQNTEAVLKGLIFPPSSGFQPISPRERRATGRGAQSGSMVWVSDGVWWEKSSQSRRVSERAAANQSARLMRSPFLHESAGKPNNVSLTTRTHTSYRRISSSLNFCQRLIYTTQGVLK